MKKKVNFREAQNLVLLRGAAERDVTRYHSSRQQEQRTKRGTEKKKVREGKRESRKGKEGW